MLATLALSGVASAQTTNITFSPGVQDNPYHRTQEWNEGGIQFRASGGCGYFQVAPIYYSSYSFDYMLGAAGCGGGRVIMTAPGQYFTMDRLEKKWIHLRGVYSRLTAYFADGGSQTVNIDYWWDRRYYRPLRRMMNLPWGNRVLSRVELYFPTNRSQFIDDLRVTLVPANEPPVASAALTPRVADCEDPTGANVVLDGGASSDPDSDPLTYQWQADGVPVGAGERITVPLALGTHQMVLTVTDPDGASDTEAFQIDVVDEQAPVVVAPPGDLTLALTDPTAGMCSVDTASPNVSEWLATAEACDLCSYDADLLFSHDAPESVGLDGALVTFTAEDPAGNSASASASIIVDDEAAPVLTEDGGPIQDLVIACAPGTYGPRNIEATDNCDAAPAITVGGDAVDSTVPDAYVVEYSATDAAGNVGQAQSLVVVEPFFAGDGLVWSKPLARQGLEEDTDPSNINDEDEDTALVKYRFKQNRKIPIKTRVFDKDGVDVTASPDVYGSVAVYGDTNCNGDVDAGEISIDDSDTGIDGGLLDKVFDAETGLTYLRGKLSTKSFPEDFGECFVVEVTASSVGECNDSLSEVVLLQRK